MLFDLAAAVRRAISGAGRGRRFGLLSYTTQNLGDEIQSIAAANFLPWVDHYIDREELSAFSAAADVKLILNGWFCHRPDRWPPSAQIKPLLISMHFTNNPEPGSMIRANEVFSHRPDVLRYLRDHGPVGARDTFTLEWLRSHEIESYYSSCLTLTLDRPRIRRQAFVALNEVPEAVAARIVGTSKRPNVRTTHADDTTVGRRARMRKAQDLLDLYARASCVVTTRLHGALPCLAMGTPVLLIDASWDQSRFTGIHDLVRHCSPEDYLNGRYAYNVDDPPPNPTGHIALRDMLREKVAGYVKCDGK